MNAIITPTGTVPLATLKERLLRLNSSGEQPYIIREEGEAIIASWDIVNAKWAETFGEAGLTKQFELRLFFDEKKKRVRCQQKITDIEWEASLDQIQSGKKVEFGNFRKFEHGFLWGRREDGRWGKIYNYRFASGKITEPVFEVIKNAGWKRTGGFTFGGKKKAILAIAGITLVLAVIAFTLFSVLGKAKDSARAQIDLLRAGKVTEVYEASASSLKNRLTLEEFSEAISITPLSQIKDYTFNKIAVKNDRAEVKGYFITDAGDEKEIEVGMKKEDEKWKLVSLTLSD